MEKSIADYIRTVVSDAVPPTDPLLRSDWAGLAFDRNRYESFAPDAIWSALFEVHVAGKKSDRRIGVVSLADLDAGAAAVYLTAELSELERYWAHDENFLRDHYVFSPLEDWLVRLDQDVTLFAGEAVFLSSVVRKGGGLERVMANMLEDFDPGANDDVGLKRYLDAITRQLVRLE